MNIDSAKYIHYFWPDHHHVTDKPAKYDYLPRIPTPILQVTRRSTPNPHCGTAKAPQKPARRPQPKTSGALDSDSTDASQQF